MKDSYKQDAVFGVKWVGLSSIVMAGGSFLLILVLTNILDKKDFGLFALMNVVVGFSAEFVDMGLGQAIVQRQKVTSRQLSSLFWVNVLLAVVVASTVFFSSGFIASFFESPELVPLLQWISLSFLFLGISTQFDALLQKHMRFKTMTAIDVVVFSFWFVTTLVLALLGYGVWSLVCGSLVRSAVKAVMTLALGLSMHKPTFYFNFSCVKAFLSFGSFRLGAFLVNFLSRQLDSILIGKWIGVAELGIYDVFKRMAIQPVQFLMPVIKKVTYPLLAKVHQTKSRLTKMFIRVMELLNVVRFPVFIGIALCAEPISILFLGKTWTDNFRILQVLALVYLFNTVQSFIGQGMLASGKADWNLYNGLIQLPLNVLAIYIGSFWGVLGIACALLIKALLIIVPRYYLFVRYLYNLSVLRYLQLIFQEFLMLVIPSTGIYYGAFLLKLGPVADLTFKLALFLATLAVLHLKINRRHLEYLLPLMKRREFSPTK